MTTLKFARLEFDDYSRDSHKFYEVKLDQLDTDKFRVEAVWGRKSGFLRSSTCRSQTKDVVDNVLTAMVVFQDWISKKQGKGYRLVTER